MNTAQQQYLDDEYRRMVAQLPEVIRKVRTYPTEIHAGGVIWPIRDMFPPLDYLSATPETQARYVALAQKVADWCDTFAEITKEVLSIQQEYTHDD